MRASRYRVLLAKLSRELRHRISSSGWLFEHRHQRPDPRRESVLRQYGDARRAQQKKGCLPAPVCEQAVWRDSLRVDHPARPLPHRLLFRCFHSVSLSPSQLNSRGVKKYAAALYKNPGWTVPQSARSGTHIPPRTAAAPQFKLRGAEYACKTQCANDRKIVQLPEPHRSTRRQILRVDVFSQSFSSHRK